MQSTFFFILCTAFSVALTVIVTKFYKQIKAKFWKDKYKLPDKIPLLSELEIIPDKNNFSQSSHLLNNSKDNDNDISDESVVDMLLTDESALQSGFNLQEEHILLECVSSSSTRWREINEFPVIIGKSNKCDIYLEDEPMANDNHGILFTKNKKYFYLDMNSFDGSIVDNVSALGVKELKSGSRIQICETTIKLVLHSDIDF